MQDRSRSYGLTVTIQLQPFLPYMNLAPKILTGNKFGSQISLTIVEEVIEVDELDKGNISAAAGK